MSETASVALFTHRWADDVPTGIARHAHGLATGLARVLNGSDERGPAGARPATDGTITDGTVTDGIVTDGRRWKVTATSAAEPDAGTGLPAAIGWRPLPGPRRARLLAWGVAGRPRVDAPLGHPDLVHSVLPFIRVPSKAPLVQTVPDVMPRTHPEWHRGFERWGFARGFSALEGAAAVVVSSAHVGAQVVELGVPDASVTVVPLGVDDAFREPVAAEAVAGAARQHGVEPGRYLVCVGAVSDRKDPTILLEALTALAPTGGTELLVVGPDGHGAAAIHATADRLGVGGRVRFTGFVPDAELRALVAGARALVHPSTDEGFGLTPLEAMAAGTPAVVAADGAVPEVVGDAAVVVARDPALWAAAIDRIRTDDDHAAGLAAAGRVRADRFRWEATARGHLAVWAAVLDGQPLPSASAYRSA